jgi:hypothetical protein
MKEKASLPDYHLNRISFILDTDNQLRTMIKYKTFFHCMLEIGLAGEVVQET